jgi:two-component system response regulator ChvI
MPSISGIELMQRLKSAQVTVPVIFLTSLRDQIYEETALMSGAVDFVDKSRSFSILLSRIGLVVRRAKAQTEPQASAASPAILRRGDLELHLNSNRAYWRQQRVDLTLAEFRIVYQLSLQTDSDLSHRQIYDIVRGPGFIAGEGENGYRANVRTFIKRIRRKFGEVDAQFDRIATYSGFGYRWRGDDTPAGPVEPDDAAEA